MAKFDEKTKKYVVGRLEYWVGRIAIFIAALTALSISAGKLQDRAYNRFYSTLPKTERVEVDRLINENISIRDIRYSVDRYTNVKRLLESAEDAIKQKNSSYAINCLISAKGDLECIHPKIFTKQTEQLKAEIEEIRLKRLKPLLDQESEERMKYLK